eukprot:129634_1
MPMHCKTPVGGSLPYCQVWVIHGVLGSTDDEHVSEALPCIWILMTRGHCKRKDYEAALQFVIKRGIDIFEIDISKNRTANGMADFKLCRTCSHQDNDAQQM